MLNAENLRARGIRAVLFDKDGTLVDSLGPWAEAERALCEELVARLGGSAGAEKSPEKKGRIAARMLASIGVREGKATVDGLLATGTTAAISSALRRALEEGIGESIDPNSFAAEIEEILRGLYPGGPDTRAMEGAEETLAGLRAAGLPLGLATSDDRERTLRELSRLGLASYFDFYSFGDTAMAPKPSPAPLLAFARSVLVPPAAIAVVGDTDADRLMAENGGAGLFVRIEGAL